MRQVKNVHEAVEAGQGPGRPLARFAVARLGGDHVDYAAQRAGARALLVALVRATLGVGVDADAVRSGPDGKPVLFDGDAPYPGLCISLSHSRRWAAAGLARGGLLGIDIEQENPRRRVAAMAEWMGWPAPSEPADFYRAWTRHEAVLKCAGSPAPPAAPGCRHILYEVFAPGLHGCAVFETPGPSRVEWMPADPRRLLVWT